MPEKPLALARRYGPAVLVAALAAHVVTYLSWPNLADQVDLQVYRFGALRVLAGQDLYSTGLTGDHRTLLFDYPPFAALCSWPLTMLTTTSAQWIGLAANVGLVSYTVWRSLTRLGMTASTGLVGVGALFLGLILWLEPVRLSLQLGQVNLLILAVVVADVLGPDRRRWAGVGVGLVAGIKLTPLLFVGYLALTGRRRAALTAVATFVATVVLGCAVLPRDSAYFWLRGGFDDITRISSDPLANTSVRGLFVRLHAPLGWATVAAVALAVLALAVAVLAWRRGHAVLGLALVGMATDASCPFSWSHHWVWLAPLLVHLGHRAVALGSVRSMAAATAVFGTFAGWIVSVSGGTPEAGLLSLRPAGAWGALLPAAYLLAFVLVLLGTAWWLRYETGTTTGEVLYPVTRTQSAGAAPGGSDAVRSTVSPGNTVT